MSLLLSSAFTSRMLSAIQQQRHQLSAIDNRELMTVRFAAEKPSTFHCNIRSDGPMARKLLARWSGSLSAR